MRLALHRGRRSRLGAASGDWGGGSASSSLRGFGVLYEYPGRNALVN
jgi:hypothetical protein